MSDPAKPTDTFKDIILIPHFDLNGRMMDVSRGFIVGGTGEAWGALYNQKTG